MNLMNDSMSCITVMLFYYFLSTLIYPSSQVQFENW